MEPLTEQELDTSMAQGFLEEWLKDAPGAVKDNLKTLVDGVTLYRQKFLDIQLDNAKLLENYNRLAAMSAIYLESIQQQKERIDQLLIDDQRQFHKQE